MSTVIGFFDLVRSFFLVKTIRYKWVKSIYIHKNRRLFFYFCASMTFNLILALKWPFHALVFGPLLLGLPHLISSAIYVPRIGLNSKILNWKTFHQFIILMFLTTAGLRYFFGAYLNQVTQVLPNLAELLGCAIFLITISFFLKNQSIRLLASMGILLTVISLSLYFPLQTLVGFIIVHNFIGFFYWISKSSTQSQKNTAYVSLFFFAVIHALIFSGSLDFCVPLFLEDLQNSLFLHLDLGFKEIFSSTDQGFYRFVMAYAFGQGVHYFVWLKAIPEADSTLNNPTNFTVSYGFIRKAIGRRILIGSLILFVGLLAIGFLTHFTEARFIYLTIAAFHGYLEVMGLPFLNLRTGNT
jgi:hypothetical protein